MSHGLQGAGSKAEPNLTPLLDMVLQLIMFFMLCVNFVNEQVNEDIRLPRSGTARPMEKTEGEVLFLNLNDKGHLMVPGREKALDLVAMRPYLRQNFEDAKRLAKGGEVSTAVIVRADRAANYGDVFKVLLAAKEIGYRRLKLRAMTKG